MASGPGGWSNFAGTLNTLFDDLNRGNTATKFKQNHGSNGNGNVRGTTPYKFGHFVDRGKLLTGSALGQFMIDSGTRHWEESSLTLLEDTIKHSLTHANPKKITFMVEYDTTGAAKARAVVYNQKGYDNAKPEDNKVTKARDIEVASSFTIVVYCPQANPRP